MSTGKSQNVAKINILRKRNVKKEPERAVSSGLSQVSD